MTEDRLKFFQRVELNMQFCSMDCVQKTVGIDRNKILCLSLMLQADIKVINNSTNNKSYQGPDLYSWEKCWEPAATDNCQVLYYENS